MFKLFLSIVICFICFSSTETKAHPLHLTVTNIDITNDTINVVVRIFKDDFTTVLSNENKTDKNISLNNKELILSYIQKHLQVKAVSTKICFKNLTDSITNDAILIYLKEYCKQPINNLSITNTLLSDLYGDQRNMVILNYNNNERGMEFSTNTTFMVINNLEN